MFKQTSEASISKAILTEFNRWFKEYISSDVIVVGAGPSGLVAARDLARAGGGEIKRAAERAAAALRSVYAYPP